ncbi:MAG: response regulator, partial [Anaerolineae bacterium]|nr:response regulator [Anaerolineae bacterium]
GFVAGDEVVRFMALLIGEVIDDVGTSEDYAGHPGRDNFVIITHAEDAEALRQRLIARFNAEVLQHYSFIDRERGYVLVPDPMYGERQVPLMSL